VDTAEKERSSSSFSWSRRCSHTHHTYVVV